jgi:Leucine-rich repeat (LRR) protein
VPDLSPIKEAKNLQYLDIRQTQVADLSPLYGLKNLWKIDLSHTPVSKSEIEALQAALPNVEITRE